MKKCKRTPSWQLALHLTIFFSAWGAAAPQLSHHYADSKRAVPLRFERADFESLAEEVRKRKLVDEGRLDVFVRRNFNFVFFNKLKPDLLVSPQPRDVAAAVTEILKQHRQLQRVLAEGRRALVEAPEGPCRRTLGKGLADQLNDQAKRIKQLFSRHFVEIRKGSFRIIVPGPDQKDGWAQLILEARRIDRALTRALDEYFFSSVPGAISVDHLRAASVPVLLESMIRLTQTSRK